MKPSRGVILCVIVARKNIKLGELQTSQKILHNMSSRYRIIIHYDRFDRNHGASSAFNAMVGSMFTVKGGISANLL